MTFSIVARCPRTSMLGVAASSRALATGAAVPFARAGVGAIATQSFVNPFLGIDGLRLLEEGTCPEEVLSRLLPQDPGKDVRQVLIVDAQGRTAAFTGSLCILWAGHRLGDGYVVGGNILMGEQVVEAMAKAFEDSAEEELPERLMRALEAGQAAGGDRRGRQSAGLLVMAQEEYPYLDLRVDDHEEPVRELRRIFEVNKREWQADVHGDFRPTREVPLPPAFLEMLAKAKASIKQQTSGKEER
jgi:uncharacterized Ntn-hydrolase superfamily protein